MTEEDSKLAPMGVIDKRQKTAKTILWWFLGLSVALMAISLFGSLSDISNSQNMQSSSSSSSSSLDDFEWDSNTDWIPTDYTLWSEDSNIAWKWTPKDQYECDNYDCISAEFISRDGCPNGLYAAVNWFDSSDYVHSYDNASLPSLRMMQPARLKFDDIDGIGVLAEIAEINCR